MNNNKIYYVCKYTPIELLAAMGASCENLNGMPGNFELAEQMVHPNICGFGKAVLEAVMEGQRRNLAMPSDAMAKPLDCSTRSATTISNCRTVRRCSMSWCPSPKPYICKTPCSNWPKCQPRSATKPSTALSRL